MQAYTHFLTAILIYDIVMRLLPTNDTFILFMIKTLIFVLSFFSHYVVDFFSKITYHTKDPRPKDRFWLVYIIVVSTLIPIFIIYFWNTYWFALLGSTLIDIIDWGIIRGLLKKKPYFHPKIEYWRDVKWKVMPPLYDKKWAFINEVIIDTFLIIGIIYI
jgi:hypothetical protein